MPRGAVRRELIRGQLREREDIVIFTEPGDTVDCAPATPGFAPTVAEL
jgi:hypothetical protein